jgi:hypothetical protein
MLLESDCFSDQAGEILVETKRLALELRRGFI